jgi:hypothetical protein
MVQIPELEAAPTPAVNDRAPLIVRIGVGLLVGVCILGVIWGFGSEKNQTGPQPPPELEAVSPLPEALTVPSQSSISVDMKFGYDATLIIDGVEVPQDQTVYEKATAVLRFTPGPTTDLKSLPGGLRRVTVIYWPIQSDRETSGKPFSWTFTVN